MTEDEVKDEIRRTFERVCSNSIGRLVADDTPENRAFVEREIADIEEQQRLLARKIRTWLLVLEEWKRQRARSGEQIR